MPLFVMIGHDGPEGPAARDANRTAHVANLEALDAAGKLLFAGPLRDEADTRSDGAVIVLEADDLQAARTWVNADAYVSGGVYASIVVRPFKQAYPKPR